MEEVNVATKAGRLLSCITVANTQPRQRRMSRGRWLRRGRRLQDRASSLRKVSPATVKIYDLTARSQQSILRRIVAVTDREVWKTQARLSVTAIVAVLRRIRFWILFGALACALGGLAWYLGSMLIEAIGSILAQSQ